MGHRVAAIVALSLLACGGATTLDGGQDASDASDAGPESSLDAASVSFDAPADVTADAGPSPVVLVSNVFAARSLAVDSTTLYWAGGGVVETCSKTACTQPFPQPIYNQTGVDNLVLDGGYLYWTTTDGNLASARPTRFAATPRPS